MQQREIIASCLMILLFIAVMSTGAAAQDAKVTTPIITPPVVKLTVTGRLTKVAAIGGETTGWAVELDKPRQIGAKVLKRLEIDPAGRKLAEFENKHLEITGILQRRTGVERGKYKVLVVKNILVLSN